MCVAIEMNAQDRAFAGHASNKLPLFKTMSKFSF